MGRVAVVEELLGVFYRACQVGESLRPTVAGFPPGRLSSMPNLQEAWDDALADEPDDWSHVTVELVLADSERMEEAALLVCSVNPWHGDSWRSGTLRFRAARTHGYGASAQLVRGVLGRLDAVGIHASVRIVSSLAAVAPVGTQGPTF